MTNGDMIRAMNDEELCNFMMNDLPCDCALNTICDEVFPDCSECIMDWLKREGTKS